MFCSLSHPSSVCVYRCFLNPRFTANTSAVKRQKEKIVKPASTKRQRCSAALKQRCKIKPSTCEFIHRVIRVELRAVQQQLRERRTGWLTALSGPPLSPPPLLERGEVKCTPSNKHTRMPMQNTLPSLLATAIFLKLMSSRAPEASLSLELLGVKWADDRAGKYICVRRIRCAPPRIHLMPQPPNVFSLVCSEKRKIILPAFICHQISWNQVTWKGALQTLWDQPLWKHNSTFSHRNMIFLFYV